LKYDVVTGGLLTIEPPSATKYNVVASGHQEGVVKLYETSNTLFLNLATVRLHKFGSLGTYSAVTAVR